MTKEQLKQLTDRCYASWNQTVPTAQAKTVYNAWWTLLHDLDHTETEKTLTQLATTETYMPRPGTIRKNTLTRQHDWNPLTKGEAWTQFRTMADAAHTGTTTTSDTIDRLVKTTVTRLGGSSAYNLHTNGDRELFFAVYDKQVALREAELFTVPDEPV